MLKRAKTIFFVVKGDYQRKCQLMAHFQKQAKYVARPLKCRTPIRKVRYPEDGQDETMKNA